MGMEFSSKTLTISFSADAEEAEEDYEELPEKRIGADEEEKGGKQQEFQEIELRFLTPEEKIKKLEEYYEVFHPLYLFIWHLVAKINLNLKYLASL